MSARIQSDSSSGPSPAVGQEADRSASRFARWSLLVTRHPGRTISAALLVTLALAAQLPRLTIDGSSEVFLHEDDPIRVTQERYRTEFGRDHLIIVTAERGEVFDLGFLESLRDLHRDLERIPEVRKVTSLINARHVHGTDDAVIVDSIEDDWPETDADLATLRARVLAHPYYRNYLISEDGRAVALIVELHTFSPSRWYAAPTTSGQTPADPNGSERPLLTPDEMRRAVDAAEAVIARHATPGLTLSMTGGPPIESMLMGTMQRDIVTFCSLSVVTMAALLGLIFRRLSGVLLPLLIVVLALICTLGTMAIADVPITLPIQVLPSFLLAVGLCDSIHVLTIFYQELACGRSKREAIVHALDHTGPALVMTSLTTAGGLASFATAELLPVMHFGIFGPIGVLFALAFTLVMLPALVMVVPLRRKPHAPGMTPHFTERLVVMMGRAATTHPTRTLGISFGLLVLGVAGAVQLRFSHHPLRWLPQSSPVRLATERFDREFRGSMQIEALIDTAVENGLHDPELLRRLDALRAYAESFRRGAFSVGKTLSVADVLKEIHQALHGNRPEYYAIPDRRRLVAQEFLLFENSGSDDVDDLVDLQFSRASFALRVPDMDAVDALPIIGEMQAHFRSELADHARVSMTGRGVVLARILTAAVETMAISYAVAFLLVTPLMMLLLRSVRWGLVAMIPNLAPVLLTLGLMGWLDVPLDFSTMMIAAIVLGLAVDDTIHFMHNYRRHYRATQDPVLAVEQTLQTTGRAMLFTSVVLAIGFLVYVLATMKNLVTFGAFANVAIVTAFIADVTLAPALMVRFSQRWLRASTAPATVLLSRRRDRGPMWTAFFGAMILAALLSLAGPIREASGADRTASTHTVFRPGSPEDFERYLLEIDGDRLLALWVDGMRLERQERLRPANRRYEELHRSLPEMPYLHWRIARNYWRIGEAQPVDDKQERLRYFETADDWARRGIALDPECAGCMLYRFAAMGRIATTNGILTSIRSAASMAGLLDRAIALHPIHSEGSLNATLGNLYYASAVFYRVVPDSIWVKWLAGVRGDLDRSLGDIRKALAISNLRIDYQVELGAILVCLGSSRHSAEDTTEGLAVLKAVSQRAPMFGTDAVDIDHADRLIEEPDRACGYSRDGWIDLDRR